MSQLLTREILIFGLNFEITSKTWERDSCAKKLMGLGGFSDSGLNREGTKHTNT